MRPVRVYPPPMPMARRAWGTAVLGALLVTATMLACANHLASLKLVSIRELVAMIFDNPLRLIGAEASRIRELSNVHFDEQRHLFYRAQEL